jgi:hypothetical protein
MRELASPLIDLQPEWAPAPGSGKKTMPETMKRVWRNLTAAALRESGKGDV